MVEIKNLSKHYGEIKALDNVNLNVKQGEIVGFLGPNGAGKSTTMNIITGHISSTSGSVKIDGFDIMDEPIEVKKRIGYLPDTPPVFNELTVKEYLKFVCDLKQVINKERTDHIKAIIEEVGLEEVKDRLINNLSKGYRQRVGLAQALIGNPQLIILDEPTVGLDPKQIIEIRNLIKSLARNHTVILSSHILPEVSMICDRIVIINKGEIITTDTYDGLMKKFGEHSEFSIQIMGKEKEIEKSLGQINGLKKYIKKSSINENVHNYLLEADKENEIRPELFYALAKIKCPILELKAADKTLEDIFLHLITDEAEGEK